MAILLLACLALSASAFPLEIQPSRCGGTHLPGAPVCCAAAALLSSVIVVVCSTVTICTLDGNGSDDIMAGVVVPAGGVGPKPNEVVDSVVGRDTVVGSWIDVGFETLLDEAGTGADPMNPSPSWYTFTELTCQYAFAKSAGLFLT